MKLFSWTCFAHEHEIREGSVTTSRVLDIFSLFDSIGQQRMQLVFSRHQPKYALYPQFLDVDWEECEQYTTFVRSEERRPFLCRTSLIKLK